jgi:hypothetical protein
MKLKTMKNNILNINKLNLLFTSKPQNGHCLTPPPKLNTAIFFFKVTKLNSGIYEHCNFNCSVPQKLQLNKRK